MDTKVIIEVVCPHCHSKIMMKKYKEITSKIIKCPGNGCGKELNIQFDTTKKPHGLMNGFTKNGKMDI